MVLVPTVMMFPLLARDAEGLQSRSEDSVNAQGSETDVVGVKMQVMVLCVVKHDLRLRM